MSYAIPDIILWAKISQPLARIGEAKKRATNSDSVDEDLDMKLYITRKDVEYAYAQDPTSDNTYQQANYLLTLCGIYLFQAQQVSGSGGSIAPIIPLLPDNIYPFYISSSDFEADGVTYLNPRIAGVNISLFINEYVQQFFPSIDFTYVAGGGFTITAPGFDASQFSYTIRVERYFPIPT